LENNNQTLWLKSNLIRWLNELKNHHHWKRKTMRNTDNLDKNITILNQDKMA
jgi:hypothetical protein